jgi:hypothetical protein
MLSLAGPAAFSATAFDSIRSVGNQSYTGLLGLDFNVLSDITVTHLGAFDSGQNGFAVGTSIQVAIFDRDTQGMVGSIATFTKDAPGTLSGKQSFMDVADFNLAPGKYSVVALGFNANDKNGNTVLGGTGPAMDNGGGLISFSTNGATSRFSTSTVFAFPTGTIGTVSNRYDAGTFQFTAAVPEPSAYALALIAIAGLGLVARRRQT